MLISCPLCGVGLLVDAPHKCFLGQRATPEEVERARESALADLTGNQEGAAIMSKGISPISAIERVRAVEHEMPKTIDGVPISDPPELPPRPGAPMWRVSVGSWDEKKEGADDGK